MHNPLMYGLFGVKWGTGRANLRIEVLNVTSVPQFSNSQNFAPNFVKGWEAKVSPEVGAQYAKDGLE
jgi:hypothetical protein